LKQTCNEVIFFLPTILETWKQWTSSIHMKFLEQYRGYTGLPAEILYYAVLVQPKIKFKSMHIFITEQQQALSMHTSQLFITWIKCWNVARPQIVHHSTKWLFLFVSLCRFLLLPAFARYSFGCLARASLSTTVMFINGHNLQKIHRQVRHNMQQWSHCLHVHIIINKTPPYAATIKTQRLNFSSLIYNALKPTSNNCLCVARKPSKIRMYTLWKILPHFHVKKSVLKAERRHCTGVQLNVINCCCSTEK